VPMRCGDSRRSSAVMAGRRSAQECGRRALAKRRLNVMTFRASTGWTLPRRSRRRPGYLRHHRPAGRQRPPPMLPDERVPAPGSPPGHSERPRSWRSTMPMVSARSQPPWTGPLPGHVPPGQRMVITRNPTRSGPESGASMPAGAAALRLVAITAAELKHAATLKFSQRSSRLLLIRCCLGICR
jgi:hypothetical protein